jgi:hypothetical protein
VAIGSMPDLGIDQISQLDAKGGHILPAHLHDMPTIGINRAQSSETRRIKHHDDARRRPRRNSRMIQVSSPSLG